MDNKVNHSQEPVSMYVMFAKMFAYMAKEVCDRFGEEGEQAVRDAVEKFGMERGADIAMRAAANGLENIPANYLNNYDMERSNDFTSEDTYGENKVEQVFTDCVFANQWTKDGMQKYGKLYCDMIDPSIARGYNKDMECIHDKHFFTHGSCTFCFKLNKKD